MKRSSQIGWDTAIILYYSVAFFEHILFFFHPQSFSKCNFSFVNDMMNRMKISHVWSKNLEKAMYFTILLQMGANNAFNLSNRLMEWSIKYMRLGNPQGNISIIPSRSKVIVIYHTEFPKQMCFRKLVKALILRLIYALFFLMETLIDYKKQI